MGIKGSSIPFKIQYASDLHLEFPSNTQYIADNPLKVTGNILLLGGDIALLNTPDYSSHPFWDWASSHYKEVIVCLGNHEFYKNTNITDYPTGYIGEIRQNVHFYYDCVLHFKKENNEIIKTTDINSDVDIIVSTLWSYIPKENADAVQKGMNDFRLIKYNDNPLTVDDINNEHSKCLTFLKEAVKNSKAKHKIVLTHHAPSFELTAEQFKDSDVNTAFNVELKDYIKTSGIEYWIYGHTHTNIVKKIGKTRILCNQLGYVSYGEGKDFDHSKCIELKI